MDDDELGWIRANASEDTEEMMTGLVGNVWKLFSRPHRRSRRVQRRRREQNKMQQKGWESVDDENGSNWVVSANANGRSSPRRNKKDKASHALDKRGWRSPGVTDYRDELFLVSFGYVLRHAVAAFD